MVMGCLILLSLLIKDALKHHTYGDFKQHERGIFWINIGLNWNRKIEFKLLKGGRHWDKVDVEK